jgi:hypothetical protein
MVTSGDLVSLKAIGHTYMEKLGTKSPKVTMSPPWEARDGKPPAGERPVPIMIVSVNKEVMYCNMMLFTQPEGEMGGGM